MKYVRKEKACQILKPCLTIYAKYSWRPHERVVERGKVTKIGFELVYDQNHYFGLGLIPTPKPKLTDTFGPIP